MTSEASFQSAPQSWLTQLYRTIVSEPPELDSALARYDGKLLKKRSLLLLLGFCLVGYFGLGQQWLLLAAQLSLAYTGVAGALIGLRKHYGTKANGWRIFTAIVVGALIGAALGMLLWKTVHFGAMSSWNSAFAASWHAAVWGLVFGVIDVVQDFVSSQRTLARRSVAALVRQQQEAAKQAAESQLRLLQAQIEPHFLLNTLANIRSLIKRDTAKAVETVDHLADYLHVALPRMRQSTSTLEREVLLSESYLAIMKIRMDERLRYVFNIPPELAQAQFPPMLLQTLVENSIKHGLEPSEKPGLIHVTAHHLKEGSLEQLRVVVADTGIGLGGANTAGTGIGLVNTRERLKSLYGGAASFDISPNSPQGVIATITVPLQVPS